jgi:homoserine trans-succinylase
MCYMENTSGKKLPLKMGSNEGDYWKNIFRILHWTTTDNPTISYYIIWPNDTVIK